MSGVDDTAQHRRNFKAPYTPHNPIPTIQQYREEQKERRGEEDRSSKEKAQAAYRSWKGEGSQGGEVYPTDEVTDDRDGNDNDNDNDNDDDEGQGNYDSAGSLDTGDPDSSLRDTSEATAAISDPKDRRKALKKRKGGEREVTDPVTHLPITIHDFTNEDLNNTPENLPAPRALEDDELDDHDGAQRRSHRSMQNLFPPPDYDAVRQQIAQTQTTALTIGLAAVFTAVAGLLAVEKMFASQMHNGLFRGSLIGCALLATLSSGFVVWCVHTWTEKKVNAIWDRETWEAERQRGHARAKKDTPESTQWLCELLSSVWPLVNPDLFTR
jgi:hypothetical protein